MSKKIQIERPKKKKPKYNLEDYTSTIIDFSSLQKLKGNKVILEYIFQTIKSNKEENG